MDGTAECFFEASVSIFVGPRRSPAALCFGPGALCRGPALSNALSCPEILCVGPRPSLCRAPAIFVSGPAALCVGARSSLCPGPGAFCVWSQRSLRRGSVLSVWAPAVSGPGTLCVGARLSVSGRGALCIRDRRARTQRAPGEERRESGGPRHKERRAQHRAPGSRHIQRWAPTQTAPGPTQRQKTAAAAGPRTVRAHKERQGPTQRAAPERRGPTQIPNRASRVPGPDTESAAAPHTERQGLWRAPAALCSLRRGGLCRAPARAPLRVRSIRQEGTPNLTVWGKNFTSGNRLTRKS